MAERRQGRVRRAVALLAVVGLLAAACSDDKKDDEGGRPTSTTERDTAGPIRPRLSTGDAPAPDAEPVPVVEGDELDQDAVDAVLEALPDWRGGASDEEDYQRPAEALQPPRSGTRVEVPFPADTDEPPPDVPTGPLEVLRYQPEGEVDIAPAVNITFNQPMVPLTTLGQLDAEDVPATISPDIPGRWQWIGTRTLRFTHTSKVIDRLPMATTYTVRVPKGTESERGGTLAEDLTFTFETPPVRAVQIQPLHDSLPLEQVFVATFDQRIDREAMLEAIALTADGDERDLRLATAEEIEADAEVAAIVEQSPEGRFLAFRAKDELPKDARLRFTVGPDAPSAEGPNTDDRVLDFSGNTYAPLSVDDQSCDEGDRCRPGSALLTWFNNPLDPEAFDPDLVRVEPAIEGMVVQFQPDRGIAVGGDTKAETTYTVTFDADLRDVFGQTLGKDVTVDFDVRTAPPELIQIDEPVITLDPFTATPTLAVHVTNHDELRVRAFRVDAAADIATYLRVRDDMLYPDSGFAPRLPAWPVALDEVVPTDAEPHERTEVPIDLGDALPDGSGSLVVLVEPTGELARLSQESEDYWRNRPVLVWVQATDLALDAHSDQDELLVWATDLSTGAPQGDVTVTYEGATGTTDGDGIARMALPPRPEDRWLVPLVATRGDQQAVLLVNNVWERPDVEESLWYVFDDRGTYRPGESVRVKGWARKRLPGTGTLETYGADTKVSWTLWDAAGAKLGEGTVEGTPLGGFDLTAPIPAGANLGAARLGLTLHHPGGATGHDHSVQIQDFRRPEFEVVTKVETDVPHLIDRAVQLSANATYYSGGGLPSAPVRWTVRTSETTYAPPGWEDFTFGKWHPWWIEDDDGYGPTRSFSSEGDFAPSPGPWPPAEEEIETFEATTDAAGRHVLRIDVDGDNEGQPVSVAAEATVTDVNRQEWTDGQDLLVHPSQVYVGLRSARAYVQPGEDLVVEAIAVDIDGEKAPGRPLELTASRMEQQYVDGEWTDVPVDPQTCEVTSGDERVECTFATELGGRYLIAATVADDGGRTSRSELSIWVSGGERPTARRVELERVELVPATEEVEPGDTAEILVLSPFETASGLVTISRDGLVETQRITVEDHTATVRIPITEAHLPNLYVQVDLAGATGRVADDGTPVPEAGDRPAYASGSVGLTVSTAARELDVTAEPQDDTVAPGGSTTIDVLVQDAAGDPVDGAEVALVVVDEAVLALSAYELGDPLAALYPMLPAEVLTIYGRDSVRLVDPAALVAANEQVQGAPTTTMGLAFTDGDDSGMQFDAVGGEIRAPGASPADGAARLSAEEAAGGSAGIDVRSNFDALALFEPSLTTGADGTASVQVELPDSLTRYRIMAVAIDGPERAGTGEDSITARLPVTVRPSAPRFLSFGDTFELPVVVQNQTDEPAEVDVVLEVGNLELTGPSGRRVTVPARDRVEVRFPAATARAGTAGYRVAVRGAGGQDAAEGEIPVHTPATTEAFATYGVVDAGAIVQSLAAPEGVFPQFGGLEVSTSSTAVSALTDAVLYLHDYDYESADAYAGRILTVAALRDVLEAFDAAGLPPAAQLEASMQADIAELVRLQLPTGGFLAWKGGHQDWPQTSIQAIHALVVAKDRGYAVPSGAVANGLSYLQNIEQHIPPEYGVDAKRTLRAYALHVRDLAGQRDPAKAVALWREAGDELQMDALAWLLPVLDDAAARAEILRLFANRATETAGHATFTTDYGDDEYLVMASDRRTDGIVLDALIRVAPDDDLVPKVVAGLLANQTQGRWQNVQENTFILLALHRYFTTFEAVTPDFVARVWLGEDYAGEHAFRGRTTEQARTFVPMQDLVAAGDGDLIVDKDGDGRLYYRLGVRYAPEDLTLDALDRGFVVVRTYEGVEDADDVTRDEDGVWHIAAGATVRVRLTLVAESQRTHVMLLDPFAAGTEPLNPELATTATPLPPDDRPGPGDPIPFEGDVAVRSAPMVDECCYGWVPWSWYERDSLRDDRAEAYTSWMNGGVYEYTYLARATTPGRFIAAPARAEEIYNPETFGRSATDVVIIG